MLSPWRNRSPTLYKIVCQLFLQHPSSSARPVPDTIVFLSFPTLQTSLVRNYSLGKLLYRQMAAVETTGSAELSLPARPEPRKFTSATSNAHNVLARQAEERSGAKAADEHVGDDGMNLSSAKAEMKSTNNVEIDAASRDNEQEGPSRQSKRKNKKGWRDLKEKNRRKWEHQPRPTTDEPVTGIGHLRKKTKKCAILMGYCGAAYQGMQWNAGIATIETCLFTAMEKLEMIPKEWDKDLYQLSFQRCARTDKGVSAAGQVVSIPIPVADIPTAVERINAELPADIRLFGIRRVTQGFNSKNWCSSRTYLYMCPTLAFAPLEDVVTYDYRIDPSRIEQINAMLKRYHGTNNFHNFTIGVKPWQDAAKRFMREVECGQPFVCDGVEFVVITVKGQSFMMHQIRKMVGLVIAVMRGHLAPDIFDTIFGPAKADVPRAPGLGLLLQAVHFDVYNQKFGSDGIHDKLTWPECQDMIEQFKEEYIYPVVVKGEREEHSMLTWLGHLPNHIFGYRQGEGRRPDGGTHTALGDALYTIEKVAERALSESEGEGLSDDAAESGLAGSGKKKRRIDII
ncbi:hypothetical protein RvY_03977 [Ramazzottius varieornatus]|uniref:Pseudouridylate synthase 1 homolog n=1 Tax=Ramazzottius varieornatus TaxID=947166 RepID=A0A1D1UTI6_RAMVA|nr:hypothetical protein RvY_03977 [Ramazzottius varieornatus]